MHRSYSTPRTVKRIGYVVAIMIVSTVLLSGTGCYVPTSHPLDSTDLQTALDAVRRRSAVWAISEVRRGDDVWRGTAGRAQLQAAAAPHADDRFRIGSITKSFVAVAILQLVAEGRLRLDDPVDMHLPSPLPDGYGAATVRQLLSNTSGVPDYVKTLPFRPSTQFYENRWRTWTPDELIARALARRTDPQRPGVAFEYSSTNYLLLARIVEHVTAHSYAREIDRRIIGPLALSHTSVPGARPAIDGSHPHGYVVGGAGLIDYTEMNPSVFGASGEMISSAADLDRFFEALLGGRLIPNRLLSQMKTPGVRDSTYGLGLSRRTTSCGIDTYGNDGDALAYASWSYTAADRSEQVTIALGPNFTADPDDAVGAFLDRVFCQSR